MTKVTVVEEPAVVQPVIVQPVVVEKEKVVIVEKPRDPIVVTTTEN